MRNFTATGLGVLAAALLAGSAGAMPYPGYFFPSGGQAGTKVRVVVGGVQMAGVKGAYITGGGVEVTRMSLAPSFPRSPGREQVPWLVNWMYDILEGKPEGKKHRELLPSALKDETDWQECNWWTYLDERDDLELEIVARDRFTPENYPQATPALDQLLIVDLDIAADAKPGRRDIILYDGNGASAPHTFFVTAEPHVVEKFFVVPSRDDYKHRKLPEMLHYPTPMGVLTPPIHIDGQAWPGETDAYSLRLKKGQHLVCDVKGRELMPYQGDAVPGFFNPMLRLLDKKGHEVAAADDYYFLPDPVLTYEVPEDGVYRLEICDNLFRGRSDCVYTISCLLRETDQTPFTPRERAFLCFPPPASFMPPKPSTNVIVKTGTIDCPGRVDRYFFDIDLPGRTWSFDLFARRQGSPLDGVLKIYGPMKDLPLSAAPKRVEFDDVQSRLYVLRNVGDDDHPIIKTNMLYVGTMPQAESDPTGKWTFTEPGRYCVTVSDRSGEGGEFYDYTLAMGPAKPSFEVISESSAFVSHPGGRVASFSAAVVRDGFVGPIVFDSTDEFEVDGSFGDTDVETEVTVKSLKGDWSGVKTIHLTATAELPSGEKITVPVTPCDPAEQAFAYTHYIPQAGFFLCVPSDKVVRVKDPHPGPHFGTGKKDVQEMVTHSRGKPCIECHGKHKHKKPTHGKACSTCHPGK